MGIRRPFGVLQIEPELVLSEYLLNTDLEKTFPLNSSGSLQFHWADWRQSSLIKKALLRTHPPLKIRYQELKNKTEQLNNKKVWIQYAGQIEKERGSYLDLYKNFYPTTSFHTREIETIYEENSEAPIKFQSLKWVNWEDSKEVLYALIFDQTFPPREFRLRCYGDIDFSLDGQNYERSRAIIRQFSHHGVLLEFRTQNLYDQLKSKGQGFLRFSPQMDHLWAANKSFSKTLNPGNFEVALDKMSALGTDLFMSGPLFQYCFELPESSQQTRWSNPLIGQNLLFVPWDKFRSQRFFEDLHLFLDQGENWIRSRLE